MASRIVALVTLSFTRTSKPQFICNSVITHKFDLYWKYLDFCDQARVITPASHYNIGVFCFHVIVLSMRTWWNPSVVRFFLYAISRYMSPSCKRFFQQEWKPENPKKNPRVRLRDCRQSHHRLEMCKHHPGIFLALLLRTHPFANRRVFVTGRKDPFELHFMFRTSTNICHTPFENPTWPLQCHMHPPIHFFCSQGFPVQDVLLWRQRWWWSGNSPLMTFSIPMSLFQGSRGFCSLCSSSLWQSSWWTCW